MSFPIKMYTIKETYVTLKSLERGAFLSVPGMALIQLEIVRPQVVTAKCSEPQADTIKVGVKEAV